MSENSARRPLRRPVLAPVALTTALGLLLAGCSGGSEPISEAGEGEASASASPKTGTPSAAGSASASPSEPASPTESPTIDVEVPEGVEVTAQGVDLKFTDSATVAFEPDPKRSSLLELTVKSARESDIDDFEGFVLDDKYKRRANYYYVKVAVENVGEDDVGGVPVPLWGVNEDNVLLPAVNFTTEFEPCPSTPLPKRFRPGKEVDTCLVYLAPDRGSLESVSFRPDQAFDPIEWTGDIRPPKQDQAAKPGRGERQGRGRGGNG